VARLGSIPVSIIDKVKEILLELETEGSIGRRKLSLQGNHNNGQMGLF
jgi:hypothetical protein